MRKNFPFSRISHFAQSDSSTGDIFSFLTYASSMQIHSFPFWWYVSIFLVTVIFSGYHYVILHYFWKIDILHSFFERLIKIYLIDNRSIENKQKQYYFFTSSSTQTDPDLALCLIDGWMDGRTDSWTNKRTEMRRRV